MTDSAEIKDISAAHHKVALELKSDGKADQHTAIDIGEDGEHVLIGPSSPMPVSGTVTVANPTTDPETGLAKTTDVEAVSARLGEARDTPTAYTVNDRLKQLGLVLGTEATFIAVRDRLPATLGQKTKANSLAVVIASDQDTLNFNMATGLNSAFDSVTTVPVSGVDGTSSHPFTVQSIGTVASGATDSGNPVKTGGKYNSTLPTFTDGQRGDFQIGTRGEQHVRVVDGAAVATVAALSGDAASASNSGLNTRAMGYDFNGTAWDRRRTPGTTKTRADGSVTAATPVALWTPASGKKVRLMRGQLSLAVAGQIILKDSSTEIIRSPQLAAGAVWAFDLTDGILSAAANNVLNVDVSSTGNVGGYVQGTED